MNIFDLNYDDLKLNLDKICKHCKAHLRCHKALDFACPNIEYGKIAVGFNDNQHFEVEVTNENQ